MKKRISRKDLWAVYLVSKRKSESSCGDGGKHLDPDELNLTIVAIGVVVDEFRKEYHESFGGIPVYDVDIFGDEDEDEVES